MKHLSKLDSVIGTFMAITVIGLWVINLVYLLNHEADAYDWKIYILFLFQIHLYTGLFITAHDAIHQCFIYSKIHHYEIACYIGVSLLFTSSGIAGPAILVVPIS